jgi:hypothetical protein
VDDIEITPGTGKIIATEEMPGARHAQIFKPVHGDNGTNLKTSDANPFPTTNRLYLPGAARLASAAITIASAGDNVLLVGTAAQTIRLFRMWIQAAAAVSVKFKDGAGADFHPAVSLAAGGSWFLDFDGEPWFVTAAGNGLILNLSAAVSVGGRFYYTKG